MAKDDSYPDSGPRRSVLRHIFYSRTASTANSSPRADRSYAACRLLNRVASPLPA